MSTANQCFWLCLCIQLLSIVHPMEYLPAVISNADIDCDAGGVLGPDDICRIQCNLDSDIGNIDCKSAGTCILECSEPEAAIVSTGCFQSQTLTATNSLNLQIYASGESCIERSDFYLPNGGNATIIINTNNSNVDRIAQDATFYSYNTDHIYITCIDIGDTGHGECQDMQIFAADAQFLLLTSIGAETDSFGSSGFDVYCPVDSNYTGIYAAPCIINMTYAMTSEQIAIYTKNGSPKDVILYDAGTSMETTIHCDAGSMTYPFTSTDICWFTNNPTIDPTSVPTNNPTTIPTTIPNEPTTYEPSTASPTTNEPTTNKPTTNEPSTNVPTTLNPTTNKPTTNYPTTANPSWYSPTTNNPTYNPTFNPTTARDATKDSVTKHFDESKAMQKKNNLLIIVVVIVVMIVGIVCAVVVMVYRRKKINRSKMKNTSKNIAMSDHTRSGINMNESDKQNEINLTKLNSDSGTLGCYQNDINNMTSGEIIDDRLIDDDDDDDDIIQAVNVTNVGDDEFVIDSENETNTIGETVQ